MNFIDFHADTLMKLELIRDSDKNRDETVLAITPDKLRDFESSGVVFSVWSGPHFPGALSFKDTVSRLKIGKEYLIQAGYQIASQSRASVQKLWDEEKPIAFFGIEGGFALNSDINNIKIFRELGVMRYTLTHFESPEWANSDNDQTKNGLNKLGIELVGEMNSAGIIVDVAHANEKTMLDVCLVSSKPIVYSHGGVQQLSQSARGVSDRAMCEIAKSGGVIGLSLFPHHHTPIIEYQTGALEAFYKDYSLLKSLASPHYNVNRAAEVKMLLSEFPSPLASPSLELFKRTLDYAINKVGVEAVAIGTDFDGSPFYFEGISDCKDLFLLANILNFSGVSAEIIDNLFWKNAKRVIWDNLNE